MLIVSAPPGFEAERRYVLDVVLSDWLGLEWALGPGSPGEAVRIAQAADPKGPAITVSDDFFGRAGDAWLARSSLPARPLRWVAVEEGWLPEGAADAIPVLYGAPSARAAAEATPEGIRLDIDVFGSVFFMITRYEECVVPDRDEYDRFPGGASLVVGEGIQRLPIADICVELLWAAITRLWPAAERRRRDYRLSVTHDVDYPLAALDRDPGHLVRALGADVMKRRDPDLARRRLGAHLRPGRSMASDPWNTFPFLLETSERLGLVSTFYFLADQRGPTTGHYELEDPWILDLIGHIRRRGHEIGLHGGFESHLDPAQGRPELERLRAAVTAADPGAAEQPVWGGRQHFLRWLNPHTWRVWDAAGLDYDSSVGFAETVGFRCGTAHEFAIFDVLARRRLTIRERPLLAMDTALFQYERASLEGAGELILAVAREARRYRGTFVGLWHNNALAAAGARRWYSQLLGALV